MKTLNAKAHMKTETSGRQLRKTARRLIEEAACNRAGRGTAGAPGVEDITPRLEIDMVNAAWTLRRLPDREAGFLKLRGALWPETASEPGSYAPDPLTSFQARRRVRITAAEIDRMQPTLDLLLLLPELAERRLLFWAAWHQNGEVSCRIPWAKVRQSLATDLSRWTLKRKYQEALTWLARIILVTH